MKDTVKDQALFSFEQSVFSRGVVTVPDPRLLAEGQVALAQNCYPARSGRLRNRNGHVEVCSPGTGPVRRVYRIVTETGAEWTFIFDGASLYAWDGAAYTELATDIDTTGKIACEWWHDRLYFSDGVTGLRFVALPVEDVAAYASHVYGVFPNEKTFRATAVTKGEAGNGILVEIVVPEADGDDYFYYEPKPLPTVTEVTVEGVTTITATVWRGFKVKRITTEVEANRVHEYTTLSELVAAINAVATSITASGSGTTIIDSAASLELTFGQAKDTAAAWVATTDYSFTFLARRQSSERLFGIDAEDETNVRWCKTFDATKWSSGDVISPGGRFVGLLEVGETMVHFTEDGMYRTDGSDPATWRTVLAPGDGLGLLAPLSLHSIEGVAVYLSKRGIAYYDGSRPRLLSPDVFDPNRPESNIIPVSADSFAMVTGSHYILVTPDSEATSRGLVYDFLISAFGGPYVYGFNATCGTSALVGSAYGSLAFGLDDGSVVGETVGAYDDAGEPFTMKAAFKDVDGSRPLSDKIYKEMRVGYSVSAETALTIRMMFEDETVTRPKAEGTVAVTGSGVCRKRIENARATKGRIEAEAVVVGDTELFAIGCDFFFARTR